jgi:hypothetical protein
MIGGHASGHLSGFDRDRFLLQPDGDYQAAHEIQPWGQARNEECEGTSGEQGNGLN